MYCSFSFCFLLRLREVFRVFQFVMSIFSLIFNEFACSKDRLGWNGQLINKLVSVHTKYVCVDLAALEDQTKSVQPCTGCVFPHVAT